MPSNPSHAWRESTLRAPLVLVALAALLALLWLAREILLVLFGGVLCGVLLCGMTKAVGRWTRLRRSLALALVLGALTLLAGVAVWYLGSAMVEQLGQLGRGLSQSVDQLRQRVQQSALGEWISWPSTNGQPSAEQLRTAAGYVFSGVGAFDAPFMCLVVGVFLAVDPELYQRGVLAIVPQQHRQRTREIFAKAGDALWAWLWGRTFSMSVIAVATLVGLWLLGIPSALSLALIAFATNFIPYLGPVLSAIPAVLIALTIGPTQAMYVLLLYGVIQLVETNLITPLVEQQSVRLPPAFTLGTQMLAGVFFGALGVLLATPLAAVAVVLVKTLYIEDVLRNPEWELPLANRQPEDIPSPSECECADGRAQQ